MTQGYGLKRGPLLLVLIICLAFVAVGISVTIKAAHAPLPFLMGILSIGFFGVAGFAMARRLFIADNVLLVSKQGLQSKLNFDGTLPWNKITAIHALKIHRNDYLSLSVDSDFARQMKWHGPSAWLGLQKAEFSIALRQIDGPAEAISHGIIDLWRAAGGAPSGQMAETPHAIVNQPVPFATYMLMALLLVLFASELIYQYSTTGEFTISPRTMIQFGGDLPYRITENGEIWRMFTAPLLHASPYHIGFNLLVLFWAGGILERIAGWKSMLGVFALAALAGEVLSIAFLDPEIVGVGASGGNTGLIAAVLVIVTRLPLEQTIQLRMGAVALLIPALLPVLVDGGNVNVFAHIGGAIMGALLSFALLKTWPRDKKMPPLSNLMAATTLLFFVIATCAIYPIAQAWSTF